MQKALPLQLEDLISHYGALAILIGSGIEGETVAFLGGVAAHRGLVPYWQAAAGAGLGSFIADQLLFLAGRNASRLAFVQRFVASGAVRRVTDLLEKHQTGFILCFRFIYGIRIVSPIAIGLSGVPFLKFVALNAIAATVWGIAITAVGYLFGHAAEALIGRLELHWHMLIALGVVVVLIGGTTLIVRHFWLKPLR